MGIIAKESGTPRELLPTGNVQGVCHGVIDLGHRKSQYGTKHEIVVLFEVPSLRYEDENKVDRPRGINKFYNLTLHVDSNLGKDLTSWRGKAFTEQEKEGFDITKLIGANCLLNIGHKQKKDKTMKDEIASITPLMAGMGKLTPESDIVNYSIADNGFNFDGVPDWAVKMIKESEEYKTKDDQRPDNEPAPQDTTNYDQDEDIPF